MTVETRTEGPYLNINVSNENVPFLLLSLQPSVNLPLQVKNFTPVNFFHLPDKKNRKFY